MAQESTKSLRPLVEKLPSVGSRQLDHTLAVKSEAALKDRVDQVKHRKKARVGSAEDVRDKGHTSEKESKDQGTNAWGVGNLVTGPIALGSYGRGDARGHLVEEEARGFDWPVPLSGPPGGNNEAACQRWLDTVDKTTYERNFELQVDPIVVGGAEAKTYTCAVGCSYTGGGGPLDATMHNTAQDCKFPQRIPSKTTIGSLFINNTTGGASMEQQKAGARRLRGAAAVDASGQPQTARRRLAADAPPAATEVPRRCPLRALISMESREYYPQLDLVTAHSQGTDVVMTPNLESEVPAQYFSWAEYNIMAPVQNKTRPAMAAAFISNCADNGFRKQAVQELPKHGVTIDSWGRCLHNTPGEVPRGQKLDVLKGYRFCLAFENSIEPDYTTEKFFECLVAGSVPVVIGSPTIHDFEPAPDTILRIESAQDIPRVAKRMVEIDAHPAEYARMLRWKTEGPSDQFKALVDLSIVHSSCRLCIYTATAIRAREEEEQEVTKAWPCRCTAEEGGGGVGPVRVYHLFVRERGRFAFESVFVRSTNLSTEAVKDQVKLVFQAKGHKPLFQERPDRPAVIRGSDQDPLKIFRIYPVATTVRSYMFGDGWFRDGLDLLQYLKAHPCPRLEVIFV